MTTIFFHSPMPVLVILHTINDITSLINCSLLWNRSVPVIYKCIGLLSKFFLIFNEFLHNRLQCVVCGCCEL